MPLTPAYTPYQGINPVLMAGNSAMADLTNRASGRVPSLPNFPSTPASSTSGLQFPDTYGKGIPGGPGLLRYLVQNLFLPRANQVAGQEGKISDAFLSQIATPGVNFDAAQKAAEGTAQELFQPGGQVASLINQVRGNAIQRGFAPAAAEGSERGILQQATNQVGSVFAQQAGALEQQRMGLLGQGYQLNEQTLNDLLESIYSGAAGAEQLQLAKKPPRQKFLGLF